MLLINLNVLVATLFLIHRHMILVNKNKLEENINTFIIPTD